MKRNENKFNATVRAANNPNIFHIRKPRFSSPSKFHSSRIRKTHASRRIDIYLQLPTSRLKVRGQKTRCTIAVQQGLASFFVVSTQWLQRLVKVTVETARVKERSSTNCLGALQQKIEKKSSSTSLGHTKEKAADEGGRERDGGGVESSAVISAGKWPRKGRDGGEKRLPREACVW